MRMRTIDESYKEILAVDPNTCLSKTAWRRLVTTGAVPSIDIGTKRLVNLDAAIEILTTGKTLNEKPQAENRGEIRVVNL